MTLLSEEAKQAIIRKVLSSNGQTITEIALANNIGRSTLSRWVKHFKSESKGETVQKNACDASTTLAERFKHLQSTVGQDDVTVGAYCRKHGLYSHQLAQWEEDFMNQKTPQKNQPQGTELKTLKAENKALKKLLLRKDKVLAEAVALLVLKKKATQIWGGSEED